MRRAAAVSVISLASLAATFQACSSARSQAAEASGPELYAQHCAVCHGADGNGDGPAAYLLFPKPRDFTRAYYKIRSTASGSLPTDNDLYQTITNGMPGSAMPSFEWLSDVDRQALVEVVESFSQDFEEFEPESLPAPAQPPPTSPDQLALGAEKYEELGCWKCHGEEGEGDGPSAAALSDDWGYPIRPNDFTRGIYKGGGTDRDIYLRFASGMDGTPMPSYEGTATPVEIWALVRYVRSLAGEKIAAQPSTGRLVVARSEAPVPETPDDPRWLDQPELTIPLMLLWQRQAAVEVVAVRALHDGESLAILLSWDDPTPAWSVARSSEFADGVAIQFSLSEGRPHFSMGGEGGPVNIWHWRADRQIDLAARRGVSSTYTRAVRDEGAGLEFVTAAAAGNLASLPELPSAVQDLNAAGFGSVTAQPVTEQNVVGTGLWNSGRWNVLVRRALRSRDRGDAALPLGEVIPIAFAVWDGDRGDRDGQKAVSTWYELQLAP